MHTLSPVLGLGQSGRSGPNSAKGEIGSKKMKVLQYKDSGGNQLSFHGLSLNLVFLGLHNIA